MLEPDLTQKNLFNAEIRTYNDALRVQQDLCLAKHFGWFFFSPRPVLTLGVRANVEKDLLITPLRAKELGIEILKVDRGGQITYHGPEQILGFPYGTLEKHTGDPRGVRRFMSNMSNKLMGVILEILGQEFQGKIRTSLSGQDTSPDGIWVQTANGANKKVASFGIRFSRQGIHHGFALNILPAQKQFSLIHPCGLNAEQLSSLVEVANQNTISFSRVADLLKKCFS
jgi:lipoate-protein ligase B